MSTNTTTTTAPSDADLEASMAEIGCEEIVAEPRHHGYGVWVYSVLDGEYRIVVERMPEGNIWTIYREGEEILDGFGTKHDAFYAFLFETN